MKVDMSPKAVTVRLRRVSQLRRLCLALGKGKTVNQPPEAISSSNVRPPKVDGADLIKR